MVMKIVVVNRKYIKPCQCRFEISELPQHVGLRIPAKTLEMGVRLDKTVSAGYVVGR